VPPSDVDVWVVLSLLIHVTESPTARVTEFGAYAVVVSTDEPRTMDTVEPGVAGGNVGDVGKDVDPSQPIDTSSSRAASAVRIVIFSFLTEGGQIRQSRQLGRNSMPGKFAGESIRSGGRATSFKNGSTE
jgi:hypothetical protein